MPRSPRSTLFPYTTLFRSSDRPPGRRQRESSSRRTTAREQDGVSWTYVCRFIKLGSGLATTLRQRRVLRLDPDRKSTRLNSSHVEISYAVFCLKKKKDTKD